LEIAVTAVEGGNMYSTEAGSGTVESNSGPVLGMPCKKNIVEVNKSLQLHLNPIAKLAK
jgi:hypothetical protein